MQRADFASRSVAAFVDVLIVIALHRLPDIIGFLAAIGYILLRDGLFDGRSVGKKLVGLRVAGEVRVPGVPAFRDSLIRNITFAAAYLAFQIPYAGWLLCPAAAGVELLAAAGDDRGMRIGDLLGRTMVVRDPAAGRETAAPQEPAQNP